VRAQVPCKDGYIGVLTYVTPADNRFSQALKYDFVEVFDNHVRVLADEAERGTEIDVTQAEKDLRHAEHETVNPAVIMDIAAART